MSLKKYSALLRPLLGAAGLYLVLSALLRFVLWWQFGREAEVGLALFGASLLAGVVNDAVQLLYVLLPFVLYLTLLPPRWHAARAGRAVLLLTFTAFGFGLLYLAATEYF